jgi:hypothetical protein
MGDREAVKEEDKPEEEGRGKEPEMGDGEADGPEDKSQEDRRSKEPEIGDPELLKLESSEESSAEADEKRMEPHAGYAGRVPQSTKNIEFWVLC